MNTVNNKIKTLLAQTPEFTAERFHGAFDDYLKISPGIISSINAVIFSDNDSAELNKSCRQLLLQLVSIECAAGATKQRCKEWFVCIAEIASSYLPGSKSVFDPIDAVTFYALSENFSKISGYEWPMNLKTQQVSEQVLYMLMTDIKLDILSSASLFDNKYWIDLHEAIKNKDVEKTQANFILIADFWLSEYLDSEVKIYDPLLFPCFEPVPNAALALAIFRERMPIQFDAPQYNQFYMAALL